MTDLLKLFLGISVMASIMIGIVLVIRKVYSKKMNPAVISILWGIVLIRLLLPFTFESPVQIADLFPIQNDTIETTSRPLPADDGTPAVNPATNSNTDLTDMNEQPEVQQYTPQEPVNPTSAKSSEVTLIDLLKHISWWSVLAITWISGIAATMSFSIWRAFRFRRKLRFCNPVTDNKIMERIQTHKNEMGVKKDIGVMECDFVHAPAVFGYFKPCILIPSWFIKKMDRDSLNAILLHEILHIRCHDILTNYIWLAAKAMHWFNPLVWFAYKSFEDDVELHRDQKVVQQLSTDGAYIYSKSLLEAARFAKQTTHIPTSAVALFENKCKLNQRIVRLVKPHRKTKSAAIISALLTLFMIATCFTTACQPTPEKEVVIGRQNDVLSNVTSVPSGDFKPLEAPQHVTETYDDYINLSLSMDASVIVPETNAYPVTEVTQRIFSDDDYLSFIKLLAGSNDELYSWWGPSKEEWQQRLTELEQYRSSGIATQDMINRVQEMFDKAPEEGERPRIDLGELSTDHGSSIYVNTGNGVIAQFGIWRGTSEFSYSRDKDMATYPIRSLNDSNFSENMGDTPERWAWLQPGEPEISKEDALVIAQEYMSTLDIDLSLFYVEPCSIVAEDIHKSTGWEMTFTRTTEGLQAQRNPYMEKLGDAGDTGPSYGSPWGQEFCVIVVDKEGLCALSWYGASEMNRTAVESAQLMDFDAIKQRIIDQMDYSFGAREDNNGNGLDIVITDIELGTSLISVKNEADKGNYLPTWYVTFNYLYENTAIGGQAQIMFCALDGSYIDPRESTTDIMGNMDIGGSSSSSTG